MDVINQTSPCVYVIDTFNQFYAQFSRSQRFNASIDFELRIFLDDCQLLIEHFQRSFPIFQIGRPKDVIVDVYNVINQFVNLQCQIVALNHIREKIPSRDLPCQAYRSRRPD